MYTLVLLTSSHTCTKEFLSIIIVFIHWGLKCIVRISLTGAPVGEIDSTQKYDEAGYTGISQFIAGFIVHLTRGEPDRLSLVPTNSLLPANYLISVYQCILLNK